LRGFALLERAFAVIIVVGVAIAIVDTIFEYRYPLVWRYDVVSTYLTYIVMIAVAAWAGFGYYRHLTKRSHMRRH
jgi:hypothetical protein